jgi:RNA polymerase sigma factor (sigma-70 family)
MFAQTIRTLFEVGTVGSLTDGQLLEQFTSRKDESAEAAFAALVARHGPMVLLLCRGVLSDAHDAEDAFQATFLVLAKKARSIRDPDLLGNWLYGVARRTAQKAKARRAERTGRTEREASMSSIAGCTIPAELGPIQCEESAVLHEEVDRLPHRLRVPIVLCYLEGLTHSEAARRLRWPIGTVRSRMARARGLLRTRLTRRGLAYAGVAIASERSRAAMAEVPHALAARATRSAFGLAAGAASGLVPTPVATLMTDVLKAMFTSQLKRAAASLLAAACLAAGVGMIAARASQAQPSNKQSTALATHAANQEQTERDRDKEPAPPAGKAEAMMTVTGAVLDPAGKPVSGAAVAVFGFPRHGRWGGDYSGAHPVLGQTKADRAGRFRMTVPRTTSERFFNVDLIAGATGFGMAWTPLNPDAESPEIEIRLRPEQAVHGRLVDLRGQPAAGLAVSAVHLAAQTDGERDGVGIREPSENLTPWPATVKTDERGRFLIRGVGRDVALAVHIRDERFARQEISIEPAADGDSEGKVYVLTAAHPIDGRVTYADTGAPVPHARMAAQGGHYISDQADAQGRFRLNPYADTPYTSMTTGEALFTVYAYAPDGQPYLGVQKEITWTKGSVRQTVDFALPRGVLVRGKVTDAGSGKPVEGCQILYAPLHPAPFDPSYSVLTGEWSRVVSREDGTYSIPVPEGTGHLLATKASPEFILSEYGSQMLAGRAGGHRKYAQAVVKVEAPKGNDPVEVAIALRRGVTIQGRVIGPDDKPVAEGAIITRFNVSAQAERWGGYSIPVRDGRFVLPGLDPERVYSLLVHDTKQLWGAAIEVTPKATGNEPVTIRLAPCGQIKIRLVDSAGKPVAGYRAALQLVLTPGRFQCDFDASVRGEDLAADAGPGLGYTNYGGRSPTDNDGRATFSGLIPGATYRLLTTENGNISIDSKVLKDFQVTAGQTLELPAFTIERD